VKYDFLELGKRDSVIRKDLEKLRRYGIKNDLILEIYSSGFVWDANGNYFPVFPSAIMPGEGMVLHNLILNNRIERSLEIGFAYGLSTMFICQGYADRDLKLLQHPNIHTVIDPLQKQLWKNIGLLNLERSGFQSMVRFIEEPSHIALPRLLEEGQLFDLVFIDGAHLTEFVMLDFFYTSRLLNPGGIIVFHDTCMPSVRKVITFILRNTPNFRIEDSFFLDKVPMWKKFTRAISIFFQSPADILVHVIPWLGRCPDLFSRNLCVLCKTEHPDFRCWNHYKSF